MIFTDDLHYCPVCRDFVPYVPAIRGACCSECGRKFTEADELAYRRFRRWACPVREKKPAEGKVSAFARWLRGDAVAG